MKQYQYWLVLGAVWISPHMSEWIASWLGGTAMLIGALEMLRSR